MQLQLGWLFAHAILWICSGRIVQKQCYDLSVARGNHRNCQIQSVVQWSSYVLFQFCWSIVIQLVVIGADVWSVAYFGSTQRWSRSPSGDQRQSPGRGSGEIINWCINLDVLESDNVTWCYLLCIVYCIRITHVTLSVLRVPEALCACTASLIMWCDDDDDDDDVIACKNSSAPMVHERLPPSPVKYATTCGWQRSSANEKMSVVHNL